MEWFSPEQVAKQFGVSRIAVFKKIQSGKIKAKGIQRGTLTHWKISQDEVARIEKKKLLRSWTPPQQDLREILVRIESKLDLLTEKIGGIKQDNEHEGS